MEAEYSMTENAFLGEQMGGNARYAGDDKLFFVPGPSELRAYAIKDGSLKWEAYIGAVGQTVSIQTGAKPPATVLRYGKHLLTYDAVSGTVTKIDPVS